MSSSPPLITPLFPSNATSPPPGTTVHPRQSTGGLSTEAVTALVVGIGLGGLLVLIAVAIVVFFYRRNKRQLLTEISDLHPTHDYIGEQTQKCRYKAPPPVNDMVYQQLKSDLAPRIAPIIQSPLQLESAVPVEPSISSSLGSEKSHPSQHHAILMPFPNSTFTCEELAMATDNFSNANLLGQGGFGYVHKGFLPNGKEIAIKQLKTGSNQGEREFRAEVETISRVHHRHLVSLVGYCISGEQRMLVYEFISNKTLEFHLHGEGRPPMNWATRLKIALGAAKGLAYLHEDCKPKIIHRDIKAANILIDDNFEAKVADFGLAKFSFDTDTHVSTRVMGTFGYMAPEYASSGKLTEKSDVFSFGVVLLELITGRRPVDKTRPFMDDSMVEWAKPLLKQAIECGDFGGIVDPRLDGYPSLEMAQMVACAAVCVRSSARRRPQMSQVVRALESNLSAEDLLKEITPDNRTYHGSSDYDNSAQYKEDLKKFRKLALESQDMSTGECSVFTGKHAVLLATSSTENQQDTREIELQRSNTGTADAREIPVQ